jgi:ABC-type nitrate/sulfonate/bicarbonate transport system ATPase subunit
MSDEPLLEAIGLDLAFDRPLIEGLTLKVDRGRRVGLTGRSGLGKTKFIEAVVMVASGERSPAVRRGRLAVCSGPIGYGPQRLAVPRWFQVGMLLDQVTQRADPARRQDLLDLRHCFGLDPLVGAYPRTLSGGELQRLSLALALSFTGDFLILDEPLTALDLVTQNELLEATLAFVERHEIGLLVASHNLDLLLKLAQDVHVLGPSGVADVVTVAAAADDGARGAAMDAHRARLLESLRLQAAVVTGPRLRETK